MLVSSNSDFFFSKLWDINSQLGVIKSSSEGKNIFSQNCKFISQNSDLTLNSDFVTHNCVYISQFWEKKRQNCEFVSRNCEKKSQNCEINVTITFFFLFSSRKGLPYVWHQTTIEDMLKTLDIWREKHEDLLILAVWMCVLLMRVQVWRSSHTLSSCVTHQWPKNQTALQLTVVSCTLPPYINKCNLSQQTMIS